MFGDISRFRVAQGALSGVAGIVLAAACAAGTLVVPTEASAQAFGYSWLSDPPSKNSKKKGQFRKPASDGDKVASPVRAGPSDKAGKSKKEADAAPKPEGPLVLTVSLKAQKVRVYDAKGLFAESPISSGRVGNPTPTGVFTILEKQKIHHSNLYSGAPMPNMNRITWSGVALHAGVLPGYPASHGCIRLPHAFSTRLFGITKLGNRVIVARDSLEPRPIADAKLFTAFPDVNVATATAPAGAVKVADASGSSVPQPPVDLGAAAGTPATDAGAPEGTAAPFVNPYRAKWKEEMARRAAAVSEAEARKAAATAAAPSAAKAADDAKEALKQARGEALRAADAKRKAVRELGAADAALTAFVKRLITDRKLTEEAAIKLAETEEKLESKVTEATKALDDTTAEEARMAGLQKEAEAASAAAEAARKQAAKDLVQAEAGLKAAIEADASAKRRDQKRNLPISVFVSLKTKKIYVRQGYEPVYEGDVAIAEPDKPIGTHVFTAMLPKDNRTDFDWTVVSVPTLPAEKAENSKKQKKKEARENLAPVLPASYAAGEQTAENALARITVPDDVREMVADSLRPGSSLLISDHGLSNEFGKFTDFTVALR